MKIPFNKPYIIGKELYYIARAVMVEGHLSGNGPFTKKCQQWFEEHLSVKKVLLTHSGTAALEMAALLCDIKPGDEIIMPSFTFVSTANAFVLRGGVPVFTDIRPDTLNIDEKLIEEAITEKTRAIVPVHYAGISCEMDKITDIAKKYNLMIIEDAAHALLSEYKKRPLGGLGNLGVLSFHETKNVISGEGGALLINDDRLIGKAEIIWEKGTNRKAFFEGNVDKYTWVDIGSSYLPSEIVSAFLFAQLERSDIINEARGRIFNTYMDLLKPLEEKGFIGLPKIAENCRSNGHLFYILTRSHKERQELITYLEEREINAVFHYIPLHDSPAGIKFGRPHGDLKVTEELSARLLRLPLYFEMTLSEVERTVNAVIRFFGE